MVLWAVVAGLIGISASLLVHRRRVWVRVGQDDEGRTIAEVAGLAQTDWSGLAEEVNGVADEVSDAQGETKESR